MPHHSPLLVTIVGAIVLAFVLGALAQRMRISPLVGYLIAGVVCGPHTPGFNADPELALQLAEIGVILLMFGVGLHFSLADLLSVKAIAVPGAVAQITVATALGIGLGHLMGWKIGGGLVFGLALSVASTVVLLRALQERRLLDTEQGRVAVGWLIVEDLAMVLTLVLLPVLSGPLGGKAVTPVATVSLFGVSGIWATLFIMIAKIFAFVALMLMVGRRVIPWLLEWVASTGSRELFRLAVLAIALGVAFGSAMLFDVSFALGAFFAGMVLSESPLSHRAAEETLPLRDAFAVMFFVSVGMLVDPASILRDPLPLLAALLIVVIGKSVVAFALVRQFGYGNSTALTISASLAQVGEFSFILAVLGMELDLLPSQGRDLILLVAILSIMLNPFCFMVIDWLRPYLFKVELGRLETPATIAQTLKSDHTVLVGYGRVGRLVAAGLTASDLPLVVIEDQDQAVEDLEEKQIEVVPANAASLEALVAANLPQARRLILAIPDGFEASGVLKTARLLNPRLEIIASAQDEAEADRFKQGGADLIVTGDQEVARGILGHIFKPEGTDTAGPSQPKANPKHPERGQGPNAIQAGVAESIPSSEQAAPQPST